MRFFGHLLKFDWADDDNKWPFLDLLVSLEEKSLNVDWRLSDEDWLDGTLKHPKKPLETFIDVHTFKFRFTVLHGKVVGFMARISQVHGDFESASDHDQACLRHAVEHEVDMWIAHGFPRTCMFRLFRSKRYPFLSKVARLAVQRKLPSNRDVRAMVSMCR